MDLKSLTLDQLMELRKKDEERAKELIKMLDLKDEERGMSLEDLEKEVDELEKNKKSIDEELESRKKVQSKKEEIRKKAAVFGNVEKRFEGDDKKMNEKEERAKRFKETGKMEVRALTTSDKIAVSKLAGDINELAEAGNAIVDDVNPIALTGNGAWVAAYKKTEATAEDVTDGSKIGGTGSTFDTVEISPALWGILDSISNQVKKMTALDYEESIRKAALIALRAKASNKIVEKIKASDLAEKKVYLIDENYIRSLVLGFQSIDGKGEVKLYLSQEDLLEIGKVRGKNEKQATFDIEFDAGTTKSGSIKDGGTAVSFRVVASLAKGTQLFGQPMTVDMPMWDNMEIKTDEGGDYFDKNMMGIRGLQTANADLVAYHGMQVITQA